MAPMQIPTDITETDFETSSVVTLNLSLKSLNDGPQMAYRSAFSAKYKHKVIIDRNFNFY